MFSSKTTWLDCKLKIIAKNHSQPCLLLIESLRIKRNASQLVYTFFINSVTRPDSQIGGRTLADDGHHVQRDHHTHTHTHAGAYRFSCWGTCNEVMSQICIALSCWFFLCFFCASVFEDWARSTSRSWGYCVLTRSFVEVLLLLVDAGTRVMQMI